MKNLPLPIRTPFHLAGTCLLIGVLGLIFTGCATTGTTTVLRPAQTNAVQTVTAKPTPVVFTHAVTDAAGGTNFVTVTNFVTRFVTNSVEVVTPAVTYQEVKLPPLLTGAVQAAGAVAPVPWASGAASLLVSAAGIAVGWVNQRRRKAALKEAQSWEETAGTLVDNVETLRQAALSLPGYTPAIDTKVMRAIKAAQALAGVKDKIHALVEDRTGDTLQVKEWANVNA